MNKMFQLYSILAALILIVMAGSGCFSLGQYEDDPEEWPYSDIDEDDDEDDDDHDDDDDEEEHEDDDRDDDEGAGDLSDGTGFDEISVDEVLDPAQDRLILDAEQFDIEN